MNLSIFTLTVTISQNRGTMEIPINIHKYCKPTSIREIILRIYWAELGRGDKLQRPSLNHNCIVVTPDGQAQFAARKICNE